jgi:energy-converting hydrogenase B subunit D
MMFVLLIVFGVMMIAAALVALYSKDIVGAIVAAGVVSLLASVLYLIFGAPDVAMTEAAIGSALTTVVFLFAWSRIRALAQTDDSSDGEVK